jgi:hypothetical protein
MEEPEGDPRPDGFGEAAEDVDDASQPIGHIHGLLLLLGRRGDGGGRGQLLGDGRQLLLGDLRGGGGLLLLGDLRGGGGGGLLLLGGLRGGGGVGRLVHKLGGRLNRRHPDVHRLLDEHLLGLGGLGLDGLGLGLGGLGLDGLGLGLGGLGLPHLLSLLRQVDQRATNER